MFISQVYNFIFRNFLPQQLKSSLIGTRSKKLILGVYQELVLMRNVRLK